MSNMQQRLQMLRGIVSGLSESERRSLDQILMPLPAERRTATALALFGLLDLPPRMTAIEIEPLADDFANELRAQNEAAVTPEGHRLSELAAFAQRMKNKEAEEAEQCQPVNIFPVSGSGTRMGNTVICNNGAPPQQIINWEGDRQGQAMAITLSIYPDQDLSGNFPSNLALGNLVVGMVPSSVSPVTAGTPENRPYANLRWITGGGLNAEAQVDIGKGLQLCLTCASLRVDVGLDQGDSGGGAMRLSGFMGFFPSVRTAPVTRTIYLSIVGGSPSAKVSFTIPAWARSLLPIQRTFSGNAAATQDGTVPTGLPFQLDFFDQQGNLLTQLYGGDTQYTYMTEKLPLYDDAYSITVTNKDPTTPQGAITVRLPFELGL